MKWISHLTTMRGIKPLEMSMFSKTFEVVRDLVEIAMISALVYGGWALLFWC
jgi:hypothetical protein